MHNPKILIVEDEINIRMNMREMLLLEDYHVEVAADGDEGVNAAMQTSFDLIISDIVMNKMNGFDMCKILRSHAAYAETPVIFITAKSENELSNVDGLGKILYLSKPFTYDSLLAKVSEAL
ncbi:MAG: response regulator [Bacteroidota bacterium]|nr:response regulator [Bacteroidota bacterium]